MKVNEKLKQLRELNHWSQEEMAEKMHIAPSSYAKIERGETRLTLDRLEQFAEIFDIDITKLIQSEGGFYYQVNENANNNKNGSLNTSEIIEIEYQAEIERLQLIISHKNELLSQKDREINTLNEVITLLKENLNVTNQN